MKVDNFPQSLSIILPLFNEQERFKKAFPLIKRFYRENPNWEFIFVDDGSTDKTLQTIKDKITGFSRMKLVSYSLNRGKGHAIKRGVIKAGKKYLLFTDIDFSTPLSELSLFTPFIKKGADVVIGTRKVRGAEITRHQPRLREWLGECFTGLTNLWLGMNISDYTCGFKLFKTKIAKQLFNLQKIKRWAFDAEILFLIDKKGFSIIEVPIIWKNDQKTKVNLGADILQSLWELILIRWYSLKGNY